MNQIAHNADCCRSFVSTKRNLRGQSRIPLSVPFPVLLQREATVRRFLWCLPIGNLHGHLLEKVQPSFRLAGHTIGLETWLRQVRWVFSWPFWPKPKSHCILFRFRKKSNLPWNLFHTVRRRT